MSMDRALSVSVFVVEAVSGVFASVFIRASGLISRLMVFCVLAVIGCQEMRDLSAGGVGDFRVVH